MRLSSILAVLAMASTACGQDWMTYQTDFETVGHYDTTRMIDDPLFRWNAGECLCIIRGHLGAAGRRAWLRYDLSDVDQPIASATVRIPVKSASAVGRLPYHTSIPLVLRDSDSYVSVYRNSSTIPDEEQHIAAAQWLDLGSGSLFGVTEIADLDGWELITDAFDQRAEPGRFLSRFTTEEGVFRVSVPLSAAAVRSLNEARGGDWAMGASILDVPPLPPQNWFFPNRIEQTVLDMFDRWYLDLAYGPPPPLGDFNGTGRVDQADLDFVLINWGIVEQEELDAVLLTWGEGPPLGVGSVPEPGAVWLAASGIIAASSLLVRRRRR